jgi:hypothetical protein
MAIETTTPGLNLLAASGGQYDRQNIATVATTFGWIGSSMLGKSNHRMTLFVCRVGQTRTDVFPRQVRIIM